MVEILGVDWVGVGKWVKRNVRIIVVELWEGDVVVVWVRMRKLGRGV